MIGGRRHCFVLHLRPGQASRYDELHHAMPSAVAQELTAAGFRNYTLFRHEDLGHRLRRGFSMPSAPLETPSRSRDGQPISPTYS